MDESATLQRENAALRQQREKALALCRQLHSFSKTLDLNVPSYEAWRKSKNKDHEKRQQPPREAKTEAFSKISQEIAAGNAAGAGGQKKRKECKFHDYGRGHCTNSACRFTHSDSLPEADANAPSTSSPVRSRRHSAATASSPGNALSGTSTSSSSSSSTTVAAVQAPLATPAKKSSAGNGSGSGSGGKGSASKNFSSPAPGSASGKGRGRPAQSSPQVSGSPMTSQDQDHPPPPPGPAKSPAEIQKALHYWKGLAFKQLEKKEFDQAINSYSQALKVQEDYLCLWKRALLFREKGGKWISSRFPALQIEAKQLYALAIGDLTRLIEINEAVKYTSAAFLARAHIYRMMFLWERAEADIQQHIKLEERLKPKSVDGHNEILLELDIDFDALNEDITRGKAGKPPGHSSPKTTAGNPPALATAPALAPN